jgi:hypothetical protein
MNQAYLIYQAERTRTVKEQREADASAGQLAQAFAELRASLRRGIPALRRGVPALRHARAGTAANVTESGDGAEATTRTFEMI